MEDEVFSPSHYKPSNYGGVECIDAIKSSMTPEAFAGFCKGNCIKYLFRYEGKGRGQDLLKAQVYLQWLIDINGVIEDENKQREW